MPRAPHLAPPKPEPLARALGLVALTWGILGGAPLLLANPGRSDARLLVFGLCTGAALWRRAPAPGTRGDAALTGAAGLAVGWAFLPALSAVVLWAGHGLGLPAPVPEGGGRGLAFLLATTVLAPIFEEIVYRERLLPALAHGLGRGPALLLSSAAFALPHSTPWATLGSFSAGLVLGSAMLVHGKLALCIGMHAGFNLRLAGLSLEDL
ncbi:MAG: CPBP family intramembrane metalloprotease [Myxococcota bacterium]|nr:CPBP family intramembrane metalloprotease [Myxococcota bacterium]